MRNPHMTAILVSSLLAQHGHRSIFDMESDGTTDNNSKVPMKEPMPLTIEELATLETLTGKDKREYVKALREKYSQELS